MDALCDIEEIGVPNDRAAEVFFGLAHGTLHEIAAAVEAQDRTAAGKLLESKAVVESTLERRQALTMFPAAVLALERRTVEAVERLDIEISPCPPAS